MSTSVSSAVQVIVTSAMTPKQGGHVSGPMAPEEFSSYYDDAYGDAFFTNTGSITDAANGVWFSQTNAAGDAFSKWNETGTKTNLGCRFSGKDGKPEPFVASIRHKSAIQPLATLAGQMDITVGTEPQFNPTSDFHGCQLRFEKTYASSTDANRLVMRIYTGTSQLVSDTLWSDNETAVASEQLAPDGYDFWSKFHDYSFKFECATATTTKITLYIDGKYIKSWTVALDSSDKLYKICGNITGPAFTSTAGGGSMIDSVHIQQSRV